MDITMNPQGLRAMYAQIGQRIKVVDGQLRAAHSGKPTIEIEPLAKAALAATAVTLTGAQLTAYADSISRDVPFEFILS